MNLQKRINAFVRLGKIFRDAAGAHPGSRQAKRLRSVMEGQYKLNKWFTPENVIRAVAALGSMLQRNKLEKWLAGYSIENDPDRKKIIAVVMAGNMPVVGFHDLLCVLLSGSILNAKISARDPELIAQVVTLLQETDPGFREQVILSKDNLKGFDAVIATGSNNTSRYFEYCYGRYPHIFRRNRNSVAVLDNSVSESDLALLGEDVFSYFGLGCRNVSKLLVSKDFDAMILASAWDSWKGQANHTAYANNLNHSRALYLINKEPFMDFSHFLLKESASISSPVGVLHYQSFGNDKELEEILESHHDQIQIIVGKKHKKFGSSQYPEPWEYPDNRDTLQFLTAL
ncbi:MAG TPA: hypothetical protein VMW76_01415 [Bacteroidales bacterium]|nr:hypothetical protein [Bacteroidales bacterium]